MHIVVCVKAVPGSTEVKMDPVTHTIMRDGRESVINPFDAAALEVALRLKDELAAQGAPCRVSVLSMGIPATEALLRDCIARGADDALLLSDRAFAGADTLATSYALSRGMAKLGTPDLILCGKMAVDGDTAQIGPELAGLFDLPCVTDMRAVASVDGAAALAIGATVKLTRALWILPVSYLGARLAKSEAKAKFQWFLLGFLLAALVRSLAPQFGALWDAGALAGKHMMTGTLFLIGGGLGRAELKKIGAKPLVMAAVLWCIISCLSLAAVKLGFMPALAL